jgi:outer membrane protein TolC
MERSKKYLLLVLLLCLSAMHLRAQEPSKNLNYFLEEAVKRSPLIKDYINQQQVNRIDSMRVRAGYLPQVTASSAGMYAPLVHGYGYDEVITNGQALEALINVNYNLAGKKNISNQLQAIRLQSDSLRIASGISILDLKRTIADQYITAFASQQQAQFNREVYQLLSQEDQVLKKLTQANVYKQVDYLTFLVSFKQQQLQWKQAELQLKNDFSTLNYLTGIADTTAHHLAEPELQSMRSMADNNIFSRKLSLDSVKIENRRNAINFLYKPKVGVYANSGFNSSLAFQPYRNFGASAGFSISVPIYDGRQKKMLFDQLAIEQRTARNYKEFFQSQHAQQLNLLRQQINDQGSLYQKINEQIKFSKSLIEVDSRLLQTGDIRVADFVIAINNYLAAQNLLRQTDINRLKLINQFNYWNR